MWTHFNRKSVTNLWWNFRKEIIKNKKAFSPDQYFLNDISNPISTLYSSVIETFEPLAVLGINFVTNTVHISFAYREITERLGTRTRSFQHHSVSLNTLGSICFHSTGRPFTFRMLRGRIRCVREETFYWNYVRTKNFIVCILCNGQQRLSLCSVQDMVQ